MKKFALIGASGFVAPRHMKAIKETGNDLIAALDPYDSVGILDKYFSECKFFTEVERFDRYLDKLLRKGKGVDYISICSPNYLHDAHCRFALRLNANAICEKPLVLNSWNLNQLKEIEAETKKRIYTVLQLRLHPNLIEVKKGLKDDYHFVNIRYITPRGSWYDYSWKGNLEKSGGLLANIGVHLFDLMFWLFGKSVNYKVYSYEKKKASGEIEFQNAKVKWFLSTDKNDIPDGGNEAYRVIEIDKKPLRFDNGFTDLHTKVYKGILNGEGFGIEDARSSISFLSSIREKHEL